MSSVSELGMGIRSGDIRSLARAITIAENELTGHLELLRSLKIDHTIPVIGFTGPPGAGKSTLVNAFIKKLVKEDKKVGVIAIDPTSPFNYGSILGDRIRMEDHFNNPNVYIRSVATRGSLGGLSAKTIEICDIYRSAGFDYILVETVGVGQSEIEIAGLADVCVLVLVPEAGDEVQTIKSGIMEIADVFVVNKADRPGSELYLKNLHLLIKERAGHGLKSSIVKAVASKEEGIEELVDAVHLQYENRSEGKRNQLMAEKAFRLIQDHRMKDLPRTRLEEELREASKEPGFNFYGFLSRYF